MNIYERINKIREKVEYVKKDKQVDMPGAKYMAVTHDEVTARLRAAMIEFGVVTEMKLKNYTSDNVVVSEKGTPTVLFTANYRVYFVNAENPKDRASIDVIGQGIDRGDKASGKATSYAMKYALLKMFNLETGENEESRIALEEKARAINPDEIVALKEAIKNAGRDEEKFLEYVNRINPGSQKITKLSQIGFGMYNMLMTTLAEKHGDKPNNTKKPKAEKAADEQSSK